ncbi:hypothetical protein KSS87_018397 [Heliosperma pusillum]|nr:hypothetical protein KSS87_018397 [Heliosperma pusillum]
MVMMMMMMMSRAMRISSLSIKLLSHSSRTVAYMCQFRQMSSEADNVVARLKNSGLLKNQALIGGKWRDAYDGKVMEVTNPASGDVIANVACVGTKETNDAISAASDAFSWCVSASRGVVKQWFMGYDLLIAHKEELGQLITLEQGKPLKEAIGEVTYGAGFIEFFSEEAKRIYGDIIPAPLSDRRLLVLKQGTVNIVMGNAPEIGDTLVGSTQVRKITFTGSTAVGKKLMAGAAATVKRVSLELGGNAPCIVFDDADLEVAVKGAERLDDGHIAI